MVSDHAKKYPYFFGHGTADPVVQYQYGLQSYEYLKAKNLGIPEAKEGDVAGLTWKEYDGMGHSSCPEELADFGDWLEQVVPEVQE